MTRILLFLLGAAAAAASQEGYRLKWAEADGLTWGPSKHALVTRFRMTCDDGETQSFERLDMPKLHLENGKPRMLFLAARPAGDPAAVSFNVAISLGGLQ